MHAKIRTLGFVFLLLAPLSLHAAEVVCGEHDLVFACTQTEEKGRLRAGCAVHEGDRYFTSEWRLYDLETEKVLEKVRTGREGVALVDFPKGGRWFILEGELVCSRSNGEASVPYRFLVERTGKDSIRQRPYTPEILAATGNWTLDSQLKYGEFRSRSLLGTGAEGTPDR